MTGHGLDPAGSLPARVSLTGSGCAHQQQVDVALDITISPGRRAEDASVNGLGVPTRQRSPEPLPQREPQIGQALSDGSRHVLDQLAGQVVLVRDHAPDGRW